ncbi:MAG: hypothetical protein ACTSRI_15370 [Promethearchaeota archaeon]
MRENSLDIEEEVIHLLLKEYMNRKAFLSIEDVLNFLNQRLKTKYD